MPYAAIMTEEAAPDATLDICPSCQKPKSLCICEGLKPLQNKLSVLILQHPQEQDVDLGTARLTALSLKNAVLKVGLSWANLGKALGKNADPKKWAVLYLGSANAAEALPGKPVVLVDKKGGAWRDQSELRDVEGLIVLDGTWSQAKAIWWRNAWLLKCRRVILGPTKPSHYGRLRKEPRRDGLSTIESVAMLLGFLENNPALETGLVANFDRMLAKYKEAKAQS